MSYQGHKLKLNVETFMGILLVYICFHLDKNGQGLGFFLPCCNLLSKNERKYSRSQNSCRAVGARGRGRGAPQFLADQINLYQPEVRGKIICPPHCYVPDPRIFRPSYGSALHSEDLRIHLVHKGQ